MAGTDLGETRLTFTVACPVCGEPLRLRGRVAAYAEREHDDATTIDATLTVDDRTSLYEHFATHEGMVVDE